MHESILFDAPIVLDSRFAHHQDVVTERMIRFRSVIGSSLYLTEGIILIISTKIQIESRVKWRNL
jgi:hypothetical protein